MLPHGPAKGPPTQQRVDFFRMVPGRNTSWSSYSRLVTSMKNGVINWCSSVCQSCRPAFHASFPSQPPISGFSFSAGVSREKREGRKRRRDRTNELPLKRPGTECTFLRKSLVRSSSRKTSPPFSTSLEHISTERQRFKTKNTLNFLWSQRVTETRQTPPPPPTPPLLPVQHRSLAAARG